MSVDNSKQVSVVGFGVPLIDYTAPTQAELDEGAKRIADAIKAVRSGRAYPSALPNLSAEEWQDTVKNSNDALGQAKATLEEIHKFIENCNPGAKVSLTEDGAKEVAEWFATLRSAAIHINRATTILNQDREKKLPLLLVRSIGGTMTNKFHVLQSAMGDGVKTHLIGAEGKNSDDQNTENREFLNEALGEKQSNIALHTVPNIDLGHVPVSYIIAHEGADRVILKAPIRALATQADQHAGDLADLIRPCTPNVIFIEGSDISTNKFGEQAFDAMWEKVKHSNAEIVFSPPTETSLVTYQSLKGDDNAKAFANHNRMNAIISHPKTGLITCNETEAVAMFLGKVLDNKKPHPLKENEDVKKAIKLIQDRLIYKKKGMPDQSVDPVAIVTLGAEGAYIITPDRAIFKQADEDVKVVNTLGAGDSFAAAAFVKYHALKQQLQQDYRSAFSPGELHDILAAGRAMAKAVIGQKGAQLPKETIAEIAHGPAQQHTNGSLAETIPTTVALERAA